MHEASHERTQVSVALCTHNGAAFIEEQLSSILAQSWPAREVIVSDDASTDSTLDLVRSTWEHLATTDNAPTLRILSNQEPLGVVGNFQQAVSACSSELIALCDQDDVWRSDRLDEMVSRFDADPGLEMLFSDATLINAEGRLIGSLFGRLEIGQQDLADLRADRAFGVLLRRNLVTGASAILRRDLFERATPFAQNWLHDEWLAIIAAATSRIDWVPDRLIEYRQHASNQIGVAQPTLRYKVGRVFEPRDDRYTKLVARSQELLDRLQQLGPPPEVIALTQGKLAHDRFRADLPANRVARIVPVLRSAVTGAYKKYCSRRRLDILRDLLQPHLSVAHSNR